MKDFPLRVMCPYCGYVSDWATHCSDDRIRPKPGCYAMCFGCGDISRFGDDMTVEKIPQDEYWDMLWKRPVEEILMVLRLKASHKALRQHYPAPSHKEAEGNA